MLIRFITYLSFILAIYFWLILYIKNRQAAREAAQRRPITHSELMVLLAAREHECELLPHNDPNILAACDPCQSEAKRKGYEVQQKMRTSLEKEYHKKKFLDEVKNEKSHGVAYLGTGTRILPFKDDPSRQDVQHLLLNKNIEILEEDVKRLGYVPDPIISSDTENFVAACRLMQTLGMTTNEIREHIGRKPHRWST